MLIKKLIIFSCLQASVLSSLAANPVPSDSVTGSVLSSFAAEINPMLRDYRFVQQSDPWLLHRNTSALTRYQTANIAEAELALSYADGHLTNFGGASKALQVGAFVESYYRISQRTVAYGAISYDNWTGRNMTGSVFMTERMPFDIVEDSLTNEGKKHRDTYHLVGGFGIDVWKGYSIGARLDYTSANYAKYKDLRHKNKLMDLYFTTGVYAPILSWLKAGADYTYHRHTESVSFNTYGKNEKVYKSLIDYGAFMGVVEQYGNDGYTDKSREMPYFEDSHGGSLQIELTPPTSVLRTQTSHFSLFTSLGFSHGTGYYGRRSPYTIAYTCHQRDIFNVSTRITYANCESRHHLDIAYANEKLQNKAENFRAVNNIAGSATYEYYDPTETADNRWQQLSLDYTLHWGIRGELPTWSVTAGYHYQKRNIASYLYPYYRRQILTTHEFAGSITRNIIGDKGVWSIMLQGAFQKGSGDPYIDGTFVPLTAGQTSPATMDAFLAQDYHLLTSPQLSVGIEGKYAFIFPGTLLRTHILAAFQYRKANTLYNDFCGRHRTTATLAIGCTF